ncbi:hypothetical protein M8997_017485 [Phyllobacterium sp. 21LDTY02-6]|jgi:hypothetical protein|nr:MULTISPECIES: hypothetical protein [unclassified Phyllobacterium]MCO4318989.1 hypothetical protein [Phyllobacterium sp. 21LDTY02-6]MCX8279317.1 hypothetical protein [Phyllobacterium sp. 0TCS1.6C]MCX8294101.1 hypothetical protein [Phyllobacterium sp. 0TCS1.6A]
MENYREDYVSRVQSRAYGGVRKLLVDVLLLALIVGFGLAMNSLVA